MCRILLSMHSTFRGMHFVRFSSWRQMLASRIKEEASETEQLSITMLSCWTRRLIQSQEKRRGDLPSKDVSPNNPCFPVMPLIQFHEHDFPTRNDDEDCWWWSSIIIKTCKDCMSLDFVLSFLPFFAFVILQSFLYLIFSFVFSQSSVSFQSFLCWFPFLFLRLFPTIMYKTKAAQLMMMTNEHCLHNNNDSCSFSASCSFHEFSIQVEVSDFSLQQSLHETTFTSSFGSSIT